MGRAKNNGIPTAAMGLSVLCGCFLRTLRFEIPRTNAIGEYAEKCRRGRRELSCSHFYVFCFAPACLFAPRPLSLASLLPPPP